MNMFDFFPFLYFLHFPKFIVCMQCGSVILIPKPSIMHSICLAFTDIWQLSKWLWSLITETHRGHNYYSLVAWAYPFKSFTSRQQYGCHCRTCRPVPPWVGSSQTPQLWHTSVSKQPPIFPSLFHCNQVCIFYHFIWIESLLLTGIHHAGQMIFRLFSVLKHSRRLAVFHCTEEGVCLSILLCVGFGRLPAFAC